MLTKNCLFCWLTIFNTYFPVQFRRHAAASMQSKRKYGKRKLAIALMPSHQTTTQLCSGCCEWKLFILNRYCDKLWSYSLQVFNCDNVIDSTKWQNAFWKWHNVLWAEAVINNVMDDSMQFNFGYPGCLPVGSTNAYSVYGWRDVSIIREKNTGKMW